MIRVLVAAESPTGRVELVALLAADPMIWVLRTAAGPAEAAGLTRALAPDVVAVDLCGPADGLLGAIGEIMAATPTPIVALTDGTPALDDQIRGLGAADVVPRPPTTGPGHDDAVAHLIRTVKAMSDLEVVRRLAPSDPARRREPVLRRRVALVAVASSTGGPAALGRLLSALPPVFLAPILVVQHISAGFAPGLAAWLDDHGPRPVRLAEPGEVPAPGLVLLAPDGLHLGIDPAGRIALSAAPPLGGFRPSATHLFRSTAATLGRSAAAVILTGMGEDGLEGLRAVREAGGVVLAQDEATSVVFGMPGAAVAAGLADYVGPPEGIAARLVALG